MESVSEINNGNGFIAHMTKMDDSTKSNVLNVIQYSLLCIVPIVLFKKVVSPLFPEVDETKGSLEISVEVLLQVCSIFVALFIIHRFVTYFKPYSGENYPDVNLVTVSLVLLFIVMSFQTQIAEKIDILTERFVVLWNGEERKEKKEEHKERVHVRQPIAVDQPIPQHQNSRADYLSSHNMMMEPQQHVSNATTSIDSLPTYGGSPQQSAPSMPQQAPAFDQMYSEPMAANEGFGGFSSF